MTNLSKKYPAEWESWEQLSERDRRYALSDDNFWAELNERQRTVFLEEADWQELRRIPEAKEEKLRRLISMDDACHKLGLEAVKVYWLMSTRKLPGWLVGGTWKFDEVQLDGWVALSGGIEAVRKDVEAQILEHRAAREAPRREGGGERQS